MTTKLDLYQRFHKIVDETGERLIESKAPRIEFERLHGSFHAWTQVYWGEHYADFERWKEADQKRRISTARQRVKLPDNTFVTRELTGSQVARHEAVFRKRVLADGIPKVYTRPDLWGEITFTLNWAARHMEPMPDEGLIAHLEEEIENEFWGENHSWKQVNLYSGDLVRRPVTEAVIEQWRARVQDYVAALKKGGVN